MVETTVSEPPMPLLQIDNISFSYVKKMFLHKLSLHINAGEMVGLLGPNGSGKTTLLRLLSGVLQPQEGQILLEGRSLRRWGRRGIARHIALVPQELHMPFAFTVEHMVSLGRTPFIKPFLGTRTAHDQSVVQEALDAAGIAHMAKNLFNELSGGERQRVTIAMALAQQPSILLLDEPTSHLDIKYQIETLELVQKLNSERGVTVIAAMHDLNLASRYFPRLLLFQRGIVADAGPAEVLESDLLGRVYGVNVQVGILRGAEHLSVLPPDSQEKIPAEEGRPHPHIHVIAGGGSGALLMRALADEHIAFVAGALNIGDSDHTLALRLATEVITEQPYAPISLSTLEIVRESLAHARILILCPTPFGPGNLPLLQEAVHFAQSGRPVVMLLSHETESTCVPLNTQESTGGERIVSRDYTGGEATRLIAQLFLNGAVEMQSVGDVLEFVKKQSVIEA